MYKNRLLVTLEWEGNNREKVWGLGLLGCWYVLFVYLGANHMGVFSL